MVLGNSLEGAIGRNKFLAIFLISQVGASFTSLYFNAANQPSVGASGAIFGLFGALAVLNKRVGFEAKSIYVVIGINLVIGFVLPGIDWHAHLGGLICGAIAALLVLAPTRR